MRARGGKWILAGAALVWLAPLAHAQHHHAGAPADDADDVSGSVGIAAEAGQVDILARDHAYQGLAIAADGRWRRWGLSMHLPYYRIDLGPTWDGGPGDPHVRASYLALERAGLGLGGSLAVMAPIGDADLGLGMGHWMFMASADASLRRGAFALEASLGYGGGLSSADHASHGAWPPVAPMNGSEIEAHAAVRLGLLRRVAAGVELSSGIPIGDGVTLLVARAGVDVALGPTWTGLAVSRGLGEHPLDLAVGLQSMIGF